jgi:hypothetical protein
MIVAPRHVTAKIVLARILSEALAERKCVHDLILNLHRLPYLHSHLTHSSSSSRCSGGMYPHPLKLSLWSQRGSIGQLS